MKPLRTTDTDAVPAARHELVRTGTLLKLRLRRNAAARAEALASIRPTPKGWQARIGGRMRGRTETFPTRAAAERGVDAHYNEAAHAFVLANNRREREGR
jgi:hypothetical protein